MSPDELAEHEPNQFQHTEQEKRLLQEAQYLAAYLEKTARSSISGSEQRMTEETNEVARQKEKNRLISLLRTYQFLILGEVSHYLYSHLSAETMMADPYDTLDEIKGHPTKPEFSPLEQKTIALLGYGLTLNTLLTKENELTRAQPDSKIREQLRTRLLGQQTSFGIEDTFGGPKKNLLPLLDKTFPSSTPPPLVPQTLARAA